MLCGTVKYWILLVVLQLSLTFFLQIAGASPFDSDFPARKRSLLSYSKSTTGKEGLCLFSGKRYAIGQKWQHILDPTTANICVSCSCHQAGQVTCESNYCSDLNCDDDEPDECCQICGDDELGVPDMSSLGEEGSDASGGRRRDKFDSSGKEVHCYHDGRKIWDGQIFTSNSTAIQKTRSGQCVQCVCQSGMVLCRLKSCPNTDCPTPVYVADDCCPTCPDKTPVQSFNQQEVGERSKNCVSGAHMYSDGEQWHPVIGPFGQMDCVLCQCQRGKIDCNRLSCDEAPPCGRPRQIPGQCCPVCVGEMAEEDPQKKASLKCFPQATDTIVYREASNDVYKFAFRTAGGDVKLAVFNIKDDRTLSFAEQYMSAKEFTLGNKSTYKVIGATRSRLVQRFVRKAKRLTERCTNRCDKRVERLENALKLKPFENKDGCSLGFQL